MQLLLLLWYVYTSSANYEMDYNDNKRSCEQTMIDSLKYINRRSNDDEYIFKYAKSIIWGTSCDKWFPSRLYIRSSIDDHFYEKHIPDGILHRIDEIGSRLTKEENDNLKKSIIDAINHKEEFAEHYRLLLNDYNDHMCIRKIFGCCVEYDIGRVKFYKNCRV